LSTQPPNFTVRLNEAIRPYMGGVKGDATAVLEAERLLGQLRLDFPNQPVADAYHGSAMTLIARDKRNPVDKLSWSRRGLELLDQAVAAAPQDRTIRLLRGKAAYKLPEEHFRRTETAIADYHFLLERELAGPPIFGNEELSVLLDELGEAYFRIGRNEDAGVSWRRLEQVALDPQVKLSVRQKLQSLSGKPAVDPRKLSKHSVKMELFRSAAHATGSALMDWSGLNKPPALPKGRSKKGGKYRKPSKR
jgi:hypothetical protein